MSKSAYDFNPYAAGKKIYGLGRMNPSNGPLDHWGYDQRERRALLRRQALQQRLEKLKKLRGNNYGIRR
jgi:hypothetical protein